MTRDEIFSEIVEILSDTFELEKAQIKPESTLYEDLDLDSIDALDMVVKLQEIIHRRVEEQELRSLRTVGDVVEMVAAAQLGAAE